MKINLVRRPDAKLSTVNLFHARRLSSLSGISEQERTFIAGELEKKKELIQVQELGNYRFFLVTDEKTPSAAALEKLRVAGHTVQGILNGMKFDSLAIVNHTRFGQATLAVAEGAGLGNYQFLRYLKARAEKANTLKTIQLTDASLKEKDVRELEILIHSTWLARDLVNEPLSFLTAVQFSLEIQKAGKTAGFNVEVLDKKKIEALKMGGLLAVNKGSMDPPTFTVLEYKAARPKNKKPIVLVGKGVVFDTGGLSLKPTPGSMDEMKCDMAGGAAVTGALHAIALARLPVHVVGLIPATDNRPGMNAYVPQDIITISDGTTVEVLNTDAEGRLLLADALVYAAKYQPELVVDLATLTGSAVRAVGSYASAVMGTAGDRIINKLEESGQQVWERCVPFPLWNDYGEEMKSDIADLKNLGSANAGHITAGKFLEHFTAYPWIHIDIAGPAYLNSAATYRTRGGTGVGVRLLFDFIKRTYC